MKHTMNTDYLKNEDAKTLFMLETVVETMGNVLTILEMHQQAMDALEYNIEVLNGRNDID